MWLCINCEKMFQLPYTKSVCPFCGSVNVVDENLHFPKMMKGLVPNVGEDSFPKMSWDDIEKELQENEKLFESIKNNYEDENLADYFNCDCTGCEFADECSGEDAGLDNDTIDHMRKNVVMQSSLSFDDLDMTEIDLLASDPLPDKKGNITPCYITDMNSRFLHTFIDANFVPV